MMSGVRKTSLFCALFLSLFHCGPTFPVGTSSAETGMTSVVSALTIPLRILLRGITALHASRDIIKYIYDSIYTVKALAQTCKKDMQGEDPTKKGSSLPDPKQLPTKVFELLLTVHSPHATLSERVIALIALNKMKLPGQNGKLLREHLNKNNLCIAPSNLTTVQMHKVARSLLARRFPEQAL